MLRLMKRSWRARPITTAVGGLVAICLAVFVAWAAAPLFYNRQVDEAFPAVAPTAVARAAIPTDVPTAVAQTAVPTAMAQTATPTTIPTAVAQPTAATATAQPQPVVLTMGSFVDGSLPGHKAAGMATIYRLEDGKRVLRLEDFAATNGPDLFVTLHPGANPEQEEGEYLQLEALKGNQGNQNYELPAEIDLSKYRSVVIWCRSFNVVFGYATLQPA